jgi:coenzyme F420 biosynthesis associated uncharacterized protein
MVDWRIARRVAGLTARSEGVPSLGVDLPALAAEFEPLMIEYTGLVPAEPIPAPEIVSREGWAEANLEAIAELMSAVEDRMGERFSRTGRLAGPLRVAAGATLATEIGLLTGYMSQRVLGQYELSLLAGTTQPRLLFVGTNLLGAASKLEVDRTAFIRWVTVHELTHALQFGGVPWLRGHIGGLLREYLKTIDAKDDEGSEAERDGDAVAEVEAEEATPRPGRGRSGGLLGGVLDKLHGLDLSGGDDLVERFREGGLAALVQTDEQRELMDRMQAVMALVEGHAEHVMDALAPALVPQHEGLRAAMDARRATRSAPERVLMRLLGMEMKMRQYKLGKEFCDTVVAEGGIEALNRAWTGPEALPTLDEIERPAEWMARRAPGAGRLASS